MNDTACDLRSVAMAHADRDLLQVMVNGSLDGLCLLAPGRGLLAANPAALELLGLHRASLAGADGTAPLKNLDWSIVDHAVQSRSLVERVEILEDGRHLLASARPTMLPSGAVSFVVLTLRDLTTIGAAVPTAGARAPAHPAPAREAPPVDLIARSPAMAATRDQARRYAAVDSPVLILGETGTGKRLLARMIHEASARRDRPFLEIGCGARPEALLDVEIFGDTGGEGVGGGVFDRAHRGTVLLRDVGDLPPGLQIKLLRFIDDGEVWSIGAAEPRRPDVRVLVASSRDLGWMVGEGAFRADLYYRLNVLTLVMPPLRERREDVAPLVEMMLARLARTHGRACMMAPAAMEVLARCPFPGNVRELGSLVERLLVWTRSGIIDVPDLPAELAVRTHEGSATGKRLTMRKMLRDIEAQMVRDALARYGTQTEAAKHLGVTQSTVARKAKQYGLGRR
ncbi:MAG TPA: sigma 54-interacting transcriptional regulator [Candidatus Binatia bacterium]|nr:sigma 54-interacting transcriptional regulator [Candidatus Binatia bacterium]